MVIDFLGIQWDVLAICLFLFSTLLVTDILKYVVNKFLKFEITASTIPLVMSWAVGASIYLLLHAYFDIPITTNSIVQFAFLTLLLNGGYKYIKSFLKKLSDLKKTV